MAGPACSSGFWTSASAAWASSPRVRRPSQTRRQLDTMGTLQGWWGGVMFQMFHMGCVESQEMCSDVFFLGYLKSIQKWYWHHFCFFRVNFKSSYEWNLLKWKGNRRDRQLDGWKPAMMVNWWSTWTNGSSQTWVPSDTPQQLTS